MWIVCFSGGLGNQMFQYAFYKSLMGVYPNVKIKADIMFILKNPSLDNNAVSIFEGKEFQQVYKKDNYKVSIKNEDLKCYIYFSGSGIYYSNTIDEFEKAFIQQDRYEWYTYDDIQSVGKYIWVRDIAKRFYILGINEHVNILVKLREERYCL